MPNIYIYAHTHWDREWYQPFQVFRLHLSSVASKVLAQLERGELSQFHLDGQAIVLEDLLELNPNLSRPLSEMLHRQELCAGPWYVLPDQMLVCGESLIRNLHYGIAAVRKIGPVSLTGYCPDTFGHSHDLPRILRGFGINSAYVWRGVPRLESGPCFWWESPDGSRVLTWHLSRGYYQTLLHEAAQEGRSGEQVRQDLEQIYRSGNCADGTAGIYSELIDGALFPCGADHTAPPANLNKLIALINANSDWQVEATTLTRFAAILEQQVRAKPVALRLINAELRDNRASKIYCNAFLLPGVLSARLYLKQENRRSEYRLCRFAEPLFALLHLKQCFNYPADILNHAWKLLLRNHPHDSICGCSVDAVHQEMSLRTQNLFQMLETVEDAARRTISGTAGDQLATDDPDHAADRLVVINPSAAGQAMPVPVKFYVKPGSKLPPDNGRWQLKARTAKEELFGGWGVVPYYKQVDQIEGWFWMPDLQPLSIKVAALKDNAEPIDNAPPPVTVRARSLNNGFVNVSINSSGDIDVDYRDGQRTRHFFLGHKIRNSGDGGDTYNFDPLEKDSPINARFKSVKPGMRGPLVGSLVMKYEIAIPTSCVSTGTAQFGLTRSQDTVKHEITTELILKRGSKMLLFETSWENRARDHRLEILFDTGKQIRATYSENHFSLTKRKHSRILEKLPVGRGCEALPDRFPAQRFVLCNDQLFLNKGLPEYGVEGRYLIMTILRAVGILSRGPLRTRGGGAGPHLPVPGANCIGKNTASYAWAPLPLVEEKTTFGRLDDQACWMSYRLAEEYEAEMLSVLASHEKLPAVMQAAALLEPPFIIENPVIHRVACFINEQGHLVVRLLNVSENHQYTRLILNHPPDRVFQCRIDGEEAAAVATHNENGKTCAELGFWQNELKTLIMHLSQETMDGCFSAL